MATVVNEMILEPKAEPPSATAGKTAGGEKSSASSPESERKVVEMLKTNHQRALRNCAY